MIQSNVRQVLRDLQNFVIRKVPAAGLFVLNSAAKRIQRKMAEPGKPITYPVNWDSVRQMIAWFASNGFGQGIPYRRRGLYEKGWQLQPIDAGVMLGNRERSARFIAGLPSGADLSPGKKQSNIHKVRYRLLRPTVDEETQQLVQEVIDRLRIESSK